MSNNSGVLAGGASYAAGRFGTAFDFNALNDGVDIPASASLNVGTADGMTMSAWIYARGNMFQPGSGIIGAGPIVEFNEGAHMWHHNQQNDPTGFFTNLAEGAAPSQWHIVQVPEVVSYGAWHHVAVTYLKASGIMTLYVDGAAIADSLRGAFTPNTAPIMHIGSRVTPVVGEPTFSFNGSIDEVQLYDRELSAAEIVQLASATGTMCVAPPASFAVTQLPVGSGESGVPFTTQPVVEILDASGNVVANATTAVTVTVASGPGTLLGTTTVNAVNGVATFTDLAIAGAATTTIGFAAGSLPPAAGSPVVSPPLVTVQTPDHLGIATQPGGAASGAPLGPQPVIEVRDAAGLLIPGATASVTATLASGNGTLGGTTSVATSGGIATFADLSVTGSGGAATLAFAATGLTGVTSDQFNVAGLAATTLVLVTPPSDTAESGSQFATQPVIELRDVNNSLVTSATGSVTVAIATGTGGSLVGATTATVVNGVATFTDLQINGPGTFTLSFASGALPAVSSPSIVVEQFVRKLVIIAEPTSIASGVPMIPPYTIELRDSADIKVSTSTYLIRMSLISGSGTLSGTNEKRATAGVVAFDDVVVDGTGPVAFNFWVIEESAFPDWAFTLSGTVPIVERVATELGIVTAPAGAESGIPFATQPVVEIRDVYGRVPTTGGTVTAEIVSGVGGILLGTLAAPIVDGVATFGNLQINGEGSFVLQFSSTGLTGVSAPALTVIQQVHQLVITSSPTTVYSGLGMSPPFVVDLFDAAGLKVLGAGTVTASLASGNPTLSGATAVPVNGTATFTALTASGTGSFSLTFAASGSAASVTSGVFGIVNAPPATQLGVSVQPAGAESGVAFATQPVVRALDAAGNLSTIATGSVTATLFSGGGALVGTTTVPLVGGVATFSDLGINGPGVHVVRFTSSAGLTAANSAPFTVTQTVRSLAVIGGPTTITTLATIAPSFAVELRDAAGIKVATSALPVTMTLSSGAGTLSGTTTRAASAGVATFAGVSTNAVGAVTFRFTLVDPTAPPPLPTVETGVVTSLYPASASSFYLTPVHNLPLVNTIEGGSKVALKFTIGGNFGLNVLWPTNPITSQPASCGTFTPTGPAVPITSQNPNLGDFDYNGNKYQLTWVTDKAWDGTCRILNIRLKDGSNHPAHFIIK